MLQASLKKMQKTNEEEEEVVDARRIKSSTEDFSWREDVFTLLLADFGESFV